MTLVLIFSKLNLFYPRFLFLVVCLGNSCTNKENNVINFGNSSFISYTLTTMKAMQVTVINKIWKLLGDSILRHQIVFWTLKQMILEKKFPRSVKHNDICWFAKLTKKQNTIANTETELILRISLIFLSQNILINHILIKKSVYSIWHLNNIFSKEQNNVF